MAPEQAAELGEPIERRARAAAGGTASIAAAVGA
jgi:hypothetical protein